MISYKDYKRELKLSNLLDRPLSSLTYELKELIGFIESLEPEKDKFTSRIYYTFINKYNEDIIMMDIDSDGNVYYNERYTIDRVKKIIDSEHIEVHGYGGIATFFMNYFKDKFDCEKSISFLF